MDINEILRIRERIEDSRRRIAAAFDAARASQRLMGETRVKLERHRRRVKCVHVSLEIRRDNWERVGSASLIQGDPCASQP
jgi:hypothetical protein